jgi:hypothetical protein
MIKISVLMANRCSAEMIVLRKGLLQNRWGEILCKSRPDGSATPALYLHSTELEKTLAYEIEERYLRWSLMQHFVYVFFSCACSRNVYNPIRPLMHLVKPHFERVHDTDSCKMSFTEYKAIYSHCKAREGRRELLAVS